MINLSIADLAQIVGGQLADITEEQAHNTFITANVEFDSRVVQPGSLFVALPGEHHDGHHYAHQAIQAGAVAVLAARPVGVPAVIVAHQEIPDNNQSTLLEHDDPDHSGHKVLLALATLATYVAQHLIDQGLTIIAITGSSGKTSTKDLITAILTPHGQVVESPGSFNNELGVPYTVLQATPHTRYLVVEMSARSRGNIAYLTRIAPPHIGVILNVGSAHLGPFGSHQAIQETKAELAQALGPDDILVLNSDDIAVEAMSQLTTAQVIRTSRTSDHHHDTPPHLWAGPVSLDAHAHPRFTLHYGEESIMANPALCGEHLISNLLCATAVGLQCGIPLADINHSLTDFHTLSPHRMSLIQRHDGLNIIDDTYNANPESMKAALQSLAWMATHDPTRPHNSWAVLGQMSELGQDSILEHDKLGRLVVRLNITHLIIIGTTRSAHALYHGAVMEGSWNSEVVIVENADEALELLNDQLDPNDIVLVKGSHDQHLYRLVEKLTTLTPGAPV